MDNRAKAQAHIERAQMYLGFGQTEFGVFDWLKSEEKKLKEQEEAARKIQLSTSELSQELENNEKRNVLPSLSKGLKSAGKGLGNLVARREQQNAANTTQESFMQLSAKIAKDLANRIFNMETSSNTEKCKLLTDDFSKGFESSVDGIYSKEDGRKEGLQVCHRYQKRDPVSYKIIISKCKDDVQNNEGIKDQTRFKRWQSAEKAIHIMFNKKDEDRYRKEVKLAEKIKQADKRKERIDTIKPYTQWNENDFTSAWGLFEQPQRVKMLEANIIQAKHNKDVNQLRDFILGELIGRVANLTP